MVVIREPQTFYFDFDWSKYVDENLKHEVEFAIKSLAQNKIKNQIEQLLSKYKHGNCDTNEPHKFVLNLSQRLDLKSSNKYVAFQNIHLLHVEKFKKTV